MKCVNGHDAVPASQGPEPMGPKLAAESDDWFFCPECPYRCGRGLVLGYGIFFNTATSSEAHQVGHAQTNEAHA